jgi:hypothetical protein
MNMYMNTETGSVGPREDWDYTDEDGHKKNAVDENEVVEVTWNEKEQTWEEK